MCIHITNSFIGILNFTVECDHEKIKKISVEKEKRKRYVLCMRENSKAYEMAMLNEEVQHDRETIEGSKKNKHYYFHPIKETLCSRNDTLI